MNTVVATTYTRHAPIVSSILMVLILTAIGSYMYFLSMSVVQVVLRQEILQERKVLLSEIAELEADYIAAQHKVSDKMATAQYYSSDTEKIFVSRTAPALVLSDN